MMISLTQGQEVIIDDIDADLSTSKWCAAYEGNGIFYAVRSIKISKGIRKNIAMHRLILSRKLGRELTSSEQVDHINLNPLDNRRANLRLANSQEQNRHQRKMKVNSTGGIPSSKFKGVHRQAGKWRAMIRYAGKKRHLGRFDSELEAARAYDKAAKEHFSNFAVLNLEEESLPYPA
jgi:hypothetical protein